MRDVSMNERDMEKGNIELLNELGFSNIKGARVFTTFIEEDGKEFDWVDICIESGEDTLGELSDIFILNYNPEQDDFFGASSIWLSFKVTIDSTYSGSDSVRLARKEMKEIVQKHYN